MGNQAGVRFLAVLALLALVVTATAAPLWAHSASRGLHLHLEPDPAEPGRKVKVRIHAWEPIVRLEIGFVGGGVLERSFRRPRRFLTVKVRVPERVDGKTVNCHAEARTAEGRTVRSSSILRLAKTAADGKGRR